MQHLKSDVVVDLTPEFWSHVHLKGSKNSRCRSTKTLKTKPPHRSTSETPRLRKVVTLPTI
ncbi:hypothetical protein J6590_006382 [Homalodisca vitripennis]|nr:hypothetical protein J6590_006382 [Homalodisca vitripennis]